MAHTDEKKQSPRIKMQDKDGTNEGRDELNSKE
jgi:hypothetical protein